ncbi:hypothetical protein SAMN02799631_00319 [Methylobacterium sp. 174MFSha1.1]|uniref:hypothetical protein n=1 Tax=Methylobacterium sp. 174MFSha1.1 TaxID=1502749 RepID=UPI0008EB04BE|nr:hypothetical protein [Methylobacterium sp. 174MFSha1.1]SFU35571.1 hypothetical protein SAMN02799631_00319 [Methylobacterium sp. 174MFSha1.1]
MRQLPTAMQDLPVLSLVLLALAAAGVVIPVLAAAIAASRGGPEPAPAAPAPLGAALPVAALGLTWRRLRDVRTQRGDRTLWAGDGDTATYSRAYRLLRGPLAEVGFSWGTAERSGGVVQPLCWEDTTRGDQAILDALADAKEALAYDDRRIAREEERRRQADALDDERHGESRRADLHRLRESLRDVHWAWSKKRRELAEGLLREPLAESGAPKVVVAKLARDLVADVDETIRRVRERIAADPSKDWLKLAENQAIHDPLRTALQILSSHDEDFATLENGVGWGKSHSHAGHVLAGMTEFTVIEASQGLAAVWRHRKQLRPDLRAAIFGSGA